MRSDTPRITVPAIDELEAFSNDFFVSHGVLPFAGAETPEGGSGGEGGGGEGATATAPAGGEGGGAASQSAAPDNSAVMSRMDEITSTLQQLLPSQQQAPDPTQSQVDAFMAELGLSEPDQQTGQQTGQQVDQQGFAQQGQQGQVSDQEAERLIRDIATQGLDERTRGVMGPVVQRLMALEHSVSERERIRGFEELAGEYPELDPQGETFARVRTEANNWAQELGNPALVREPGFVELVTLATRAAERGSSEVTPSQQQNGQLESAGGARPGGTGTEQANRFDQIKQAGGAQGVFGRVG